jgi:hypothetical protein
MGRTPAWPSWIEVDPALVPIDAEDQVVADHSGGRWIYHPDGRLTIISKDPEPPLPELDEQ